MPHGTLKKIKESQYPPARPTTGTAPLGWAKVTRLGTTGKGEDSSVECGENVIGWTWCRVEVPGGGIWLLSRKRIKGLWLTTLIRGIF
jgi:hypothetical protein